ncbi:serine/threonine phosphatase [Pantoea rodasii]|uniref:Serine/threonine phosphatase n=1 Tax=Pantoea rodasii TaxID=1076549 RepID=A0A2M9WFC8_9GAMM|nr:protein phosphatase 2C domain-containing protein [Pantoea rodasii]ORM57564.1 serine/threonine phosphatase [Pantoea rodasii]PJZ06225.1 serine/threonine phosphatase [Pantoea rodasii]
MKMMFASRCQQGMRDENQDRTGTEFDEQKACFLVCDGVAGLPGGEMAAQIVRDSLLTQLHNSVEFTPESTRAAIEQCQQVLLDAQGKNPKYARMSTTLAALFIDREKQRAWWAHAGDSRVYHFRHGVLSQVTRDHSLAQQLREAGYENTGINSNLLYNALGVEPARPATFSEVISLTDGDAFLVCTDGFWLNLTTHEMEQALRMVNACEEWLTLMEQAVNRSVKNDNLSALAIWIGEPQEATLLYSQADAARFLPTRY